MMRIAFATVSIAASVVLAACTSNSQEKNYKLLEEDRPMFETEHRPSGRGPATDLHLTALDPDVELTVQTAPPPTGGQRQSVIPITFEDRQTWNAITIGPADGRTRHWPIYFRDVTWQRDIHPVTPEAAFEQYVGPDSDPAWTAAYAAAAVVQPAKFFIDLATLPLQMVIAPPLVNQTTP